MNPAELGKQCAENINFCAANKLPVEDAGIMLTTPKGWKAPPRFPRGKLCVVKPDGTRVWRFKATNVLAWLAGNGLVNVKIEEMKK